MSEKENLSNQLNNEINLFDDNEEINLFDNSKKKISLGTYIGVVITVCGLAILITDRYLDYRTTLLTEELANQSIAIDIPVEDDEVESDELGLLVDEEQEDEIVYVTGDQEVAEVKDYKNVISIPDQDILAKINEGVSSEDLRYGVGHYTNTAKIGKKGNCVIAGHSSPIYSCIFNNLHNMKIGDMFMIYDAKGKCHKYFITDIKVVEPTSVDILDPIAEDISQVTLFTCIDKGTKRLVLIGQERTDEEIYLLAQAKKQEKITSMSTIHNNISISPLFE